MKDAFVGYHYTRARLDQMEDPEEAHARRGAHWTYNAEAFIQAIQTLRKDGDPCTNPRDDAPLLK